MEKKEPRKRTSVGSFTELLEGVPGIKEVKLSREITGRYRILEVICGEPFDSYFIKQNINLKPQDTLEIEARAQKEVELYCLLKRYTDYVNEVEKVKIHEINWNAKNPVNVSYETLMKSGGKGLMNYRNQAGINISDLVQVFCQSATALGTAHGLGVWHGDIRPINLHFDNNRLVLIGFDIFSKNESGSIVDKYISYKSCKGVGFASIYCPPEVIHYKSTKEQPQVSAEKFDIYCWGMCMLQFITNMKDDKFNSFTSKLKKSPEECSVCLKKIKTLKLQGIKDEVSHSLMILICKCLQYKPYARLSMKNLIYNIASSKSKCHVLFELLNKEMKKEIGLFTRKSINFIPGISKHEAASVFQKSSDKMLQPEKDELIDYIEKRVSIGSDSILDKIETIMGNKAHLKGIIFGLTY